MFQSIIAPERTVLKPNLNYERQDTTSSDARTSVDHCDKHDWSYRETCGEIDFRIQGLPHSAAQKHDHIRKKAVQKQRSIVLKLYMLRLSVDHLLILCRLLQISSRLLVCVSSLDHSILAVTGTPCDISCAQPFHDE